MTPVVSLIDKIGCVTRTVQQGRIVGLDLNSRRCFLRRASVTCAEMKRFPSTDHRSLNVFYKWLVWLEWLKEERFIDDKEKEKMGAQLNNVKPYIT